MLLISFKIGNGSIELNFHLLWRKKFYSRSDWIALDLNVSIAIIEGSDVLDYPWTSLFNWIQPLNLDLLESLSEVSPSRFRRPLLTTMTLSHLRESNVKSLEVSE